MAYGYDIQDPSEGYDDEYVKRLRQSYLDQMPDAAPAASAPAPSPEPALAPPSSVQLPPSVPPPSEFGPVYTAQAAPEVEPTRQIANTPAPYQTAGGVGVSQDQFNVGVEPGRTYQGMPGFETGRINDPNEKDPKYVMARIIQNMGLSAEDPRSAEILFAELQKRFPGVTRSGDVLDFSQVPGISQFGAPVAQDFITNSAPGGGTGPGASWAFMNAGGGGPQPIPTGTRTPGPSSPFNGFTFNPTTGYQFGYGGGGQLPPELANFYNTQSRVIEQQQAQQAQIQASMRDALLRLMAQGQEPVDVNTDATLGPAAKAYRDAQRREQSRGRDALAERAAFTGLNLGGQGSGSFDSALQSQEEDTRNAIAGYEAQLAQTELQNRRSLLVNALQIAQALGARTEASDLQRELAQLDAQLRQQQLQYQYATLGSQNRQFDDSLGFNYNQLFADMDYRTAMLAAMNG